MTTPQFIDGSKDVTRRLGWWNVRPGQILCGVEKGMGLKLNEKIKKLGMIEVISAIPQPLQALLDCHEYGVSEMIREGFPDMRPEQFVAMLCKHYKVTPSEPFNRIEFKKIL